MGKKVLWLPCVASGVIKTNISAKPVTLVTDKRREFAYFNQVWPRKSRATTRASWELTTGYRGTELIRWINLSQIRFRIWPAALPRQVLLAAALNVRVASRLTRRRKAGPRMNGRRTLPGRTPRGLASSEEGSKSQGRRAGHNAANAEWMSGSESFWRKVQDGQQSNLRLSEVFHAEQIQVRLPTTISCYFHAG